MSDTVLMLKALADENRLRIFRTLVNGETCACKLLEQLNVSQPTLSHHMRILVSSGLVNARKDAQWMRYSINKDSLNQLRSFFDDIDISNIPVINPDCDCR